MVVEEKGMTVKELASRANCHVNTIKTYIRKKLLPTRRESCNKGQGRHGFRYVVPYEAAQDVTISPGQVVLIPTGLKAYMQPGEVLQVHIRSSLGIKRGLSLANNTGVIDADYYNNPDNEGHIFLGIRNHGDEPVEVRKGSAIAQGIFMKYLAADGDEASGAREGGIGSTGA